MLIGSIDNRHPTSKMISHACRVVSRTLHVYEFMWKVKYLRYVVICEDVFMIMRMFDNICVIVMMGMNCELWVYWWYLCTCDDGVKLLILWINKMMMCILDILLVYDIWELLHLIGILNVVICEHSIIRKMNICWCEILICYAWIHNFLMLNVNLPSNTPMVVWLCVSPL